MMRNAYVIVFLAVMSPSASAQSWLDFKRSEPNVEAGAEALERGEYGHAQEAFESAQTETKEHRAALQYNLGSALMGLVESMPAPTADATDPNAAAAEDPRAPLIEQAVEAFSRAGALSEDSRMRSDASLWRGNGLVQKNDLKGAVNAYKQAVVENPQNGVARQNLLSALRMMEQQPPSGGGEGDDEEGEEGEEGEKGEEGEGSDEEQKEQEQKEDEQGEGGDENEGEEEKQDDQEGQGDQDDKGEEEEKKDQGQEGKDGDEKDKEQKEQESAGDKDKADKDKKSPQDKMDEKDNKGNDKGQGARPADQKPTDPKKVNAEALLDALRQKERPLMPYQMRDQRQKLIAPEKNW